VEALEKTGKKGWILIFGKYMKQTGMYRIILVTIVIRVAYWYTSLFSAETANTASTEVVTSFPLGDNIITVAPISLNSSGAVSDRFMRLFLKNRTEDKGIAYDLVWNEANAKMARAKTRHDFLECARVYYYLIESGIRNGELFYNTGTALLLAGEYDRALSAFIRSERYLGATWEIKQNMQSALVGQMKTPEELQNTWYRHVFFWHYRYGLRFRVILAICGILFTATGLCLWSFFKNKYAIGFIIAGILLNTFFVPSILITIIQETSDIPPILL
jgi:hypothetical protein